MSAANSPLNLNSTLMNNCPSLPFTSQLDPAELGSFVRSFVERRELFLSLAAKHGSPLYVLEEAVLLDRASRFVAAFRAELPDVRVYYAVKTNNCPEVARLLVRTGLGLDVSSGLELELAISAGATDIVFSGPGKTDAELAAAVRHRDRVTVLMDSFAELERLDRSAAAAGEPVRAGVRLTADERGLWRKFGIRLDALPRFFGRAAACRGIRLSGLQFHTSWNLDPGRQVAFIERLGADLRRLDASHRAAIEFLDVGGGFWPPQGEWLLPAAMPEGRLRIDATDCSEPLVHHRVPAAPIETFAREIGNAVRTHVFPTGRCRVCAEPGRWIVNDAMHILLTVVDRKAEDLVITDAGTNAVGWERFESDYFPVINLTRPSAVERPCHVLGSLCTPHDVWGYAYHGEDIQPGDVLLVPTQGAYTWSLRQHFIKPLPKVVVIPVEAETRDEPTSYRYPDDRPTAG